MSISDRPARISSTCKLFVLLTFTLLLATTVNAQDNTNTNGNTANTNASANRNANANANHNANANANTNANTNTNASQNGNANTNANANSNRSVSEREEARRDKLVETNWFYVIVIAMFAVVMVPFAWTIVRAVRFSHASYGPLGLPDGSLRAMLAYTLVAFLGFYIMASILSISEFGPPQFLLGIVATVIGFYFGSRSAEGSSTPKTGVVEGTVFDKNGVAAAQASVELSPESSGKKLSQTADASGKYKFDNVPAGDYNIQASLTGNAPSAPKKIKVTAGEPQTVDLKLQ
jgi:Carboxypeptidase regulatory-like domain